MALIGERGVLPALLVLLVLDLVVGLLQALAQAVLLVLDLLLVVCPWPSKRF
jgi:hypothetical protein